MKYNRILSNFLTFVSIGFLFLTCTNNPFGKDDISGSTVSIIGNVYSSAGAVLEGCYVWLAGVNVGTFSTKDTGFKLNIPPPNSQPGGGITGAFKLYCFLSNYKTDTTTVVLHRGQLQLDQGGINENGETKKAFRLTKLADINVSVTPNSFPLPPPYNDPISEHCNPYTGYDDPMQVTMTVNSTVDYLLIKYPRTLKGPASLLILKQIDADIDFMTMIAIDSSITGSNLASSYVAYGNSSWQADHTLAPGFLPKGNYFVFPYFFITQPDIPDELINNLIQNRQNPGFDILNVPVKMTVGKLAITK